MFKRLITALSVALTLTAIFLIQSNRDKPESAIRGDYGGFTPLDFIAPLPPSASPTPSPTPNPYVKYHNEIFKPVYLSAARLETTTLELTSLGRHFITAYCPYECGGSWQTASGATCYRASEANRYKEPTTCAIDRKNYSFGDLFYISEFDRVFIAQDTGSAVKGKHLDLFYEDYSDVLSFPTGYYTVYAVEVNTFLEPAYNYDVKEIFKDDFIDKTIKQAYNK